MFSDCIRIYNLMERFSKPWFICGGWALDLFLGRQMREHKDVEIGIFRDDQIELKTYLGGGKFFKINNGEGYAREPWGGEYIEMPIHELYFSNTSIELEILLNESNENEWIYRRDKSVTTPKSLAIMSDGSGILFLAPELILLYKSKNIRDKDVTDFRNVWPSLSEQKREWLANYLQNKCNLSIEIDFGLGDSI